MTPGPLGTVSQLVHLRQGSCLVTAGPGPNPNPGNLSPPSHRVMANNGSRPFPADTRLVFAYGHLMDGPKEGVLVGPIEPGVEFSVTVPLVAPCANNQYIGTCVDIVISRQPQADQGSTFSCTSK